MEIKKFIMTLSFALLALNSNATCLEKTSETLKQLEKTNHRLEDITFLAAPPVVLAGLSTSMGPIAIAGAGTIGGAVFMAGLFTSIIPYNIHLGVQADYRSILNKQTLIKQAEAGDGQELRVLHHNIEKYLNQKVDLNFVSEMLLSLDNSEKICTDGHKEKVVYKENKDIDNEIEKYLAEHL